ncbi:MAG: hypothetical protein OEM62_00045 [Acidobacteriota bacterium]|nr:hypothetical protein [Acidobacteriota bacterium]
MSHSFARPLSVGRFTKITLLAWLAFLGIDFFVHGALLAEWYQRGAPALLSLEQAFARIPLGYASFLLLTGLVVWIGARLELMGWRQGLAFGSVVGTVLAGAHSLALVSITTLSPQLAMWWGLAEALELAVAGSVVGAALSAPRLGRLTAVVAAFVVFLVVLTITWQNV